MKTLIEKAENLLSQCDVLTIATIDENGCPRPVPMSKSAAEGIRSIWFATGATSLKTAHIKTDPRAGVSFYIGGDSVVLTGTAEIVTDSDTKHRMWQQWYIEHFPLGMDDPEYVLVRFDARDATIYIDREFVRESLA